MPPKRTRILFIERQPSESVSIERVFAEIARHFPSDECEIEFQKLKYGNGLGGLIKNLLFFRKNQADIYHITGHAHYMALVLPSKRTVLTIHDLVFLHNRSGLRRWVLKKVFLDWPLWKLPFLTTVSEATKREIGDFHTDIRDRVRVIENPVFSAFQPSEVKVFDKKRPLILQVGTTPNKNVPRLIEALADVECRLKIIGTLDNNIREALARFETRYETAANLSDDEIVTEYRRADIVSYCSTYEGFGLPVLEAQAVGKPLIASSIEPIRSVAGTGALLVDPRDAGSIRKGIIRLIDDDKLRNDLISKGFENVKRYAPSSAAARYCELYREIVKGLS